MSLLLYLCSKSHLFRNMVIKIYDLEILVQNQNVQLLQWQMFDVRCSIFNVQCSMYNVRCLIGNVKNYIICVFVSNISRWKFRSTTRNTKFAKAPINGRFDILSRIFSLYLSTSEILSFRFCDLGTSGQEKKCTKFVETPCDIPRIATPPHGPCDAKEICREHPL